MKKVILALAIVSVSFAACNDGAKTETPATDSVTAPAPAPVDTAATAPVDTAAKAPAADTTKK
jgi:PBP1b-binding outer membrane lipoprotein LpoB